MESTYKLQTVERAISFLEYVAASDEPPHIREVSEALELNITTCYHLLRTLTARNYIERNADGGLELGDGVEILARGYRRAQSTEKYLSEVVRGLAKTTLETSFLSLREDNSVILKVLLEGSQRLKVGGLYVGLKGREHTRASGKAILAFLEESERTAMLQDSMNELSERQKKSTLKALEKELKQIAVRGWALDEGQTEHGIIAIAAPIFGPSDEVFGAVGIVAPLFRIDKSRQTYLDNVVAAAAEATSLLKNI